MTRTVDAFPTKEFFVHMITRDITLEDCVLDLLDNSIDGARQSIRNQINNGNSKHTSIDLSDYGVRIKISNNRFEIEDNCGGISIEKATKYAFRFGRSPNAPMDIEGSIGLYGIGMKRAVLKMGNKIEIRSSTKTEAFSMEIFVDDWLRDPKKWDFELKEDEIWDHTGTKIVVTELYDPIKEEFVDNTFQTDLRKIIARDYSFFLQSGLTVVLNNDQVERYRFEFAQSDQIKPAKIAYKDPTGVSVEITAGMVDFPPDESTPEDLISVRYKETEYFGWFVVCNDRVVLAADRTERTIWGDEGFTRWHPQYNGFMGIVRFYSDDPNELPWRTTKRDVEESKPIYRRAIVRMKELTRPWINYTTARKGNLDEAKKLERVAIAKPIESVSERAKMSLPVIERKPKVRMATIQYSKPLEDVDRIRSAIGNRRLPYSDVGRITFEYYLDNELEE